MARALQKIELVALITVFPRIREVEREGRDRYGKGRNARGVDARGFARPLPRLNRMTYGSQAHKDLFCTTFVETHRTFEPRELPWPELDSTSIDRLRAIPFWPVALAAERNAGYMVTAFAERLDDPALRAALAVQGVEETRHANLLAAMLAKYDVEIKEIPVKPLEPTERNFLDFGYEECIDSFFGFGIFGLAKNIQLFIPALTDIFEIVLLEEARHVTFFVNWIAYERYRRGRAFAPFQAFATGLGYARAIRRIVTTFGPKAADGERELQTQGVGFGAEGAFAMFEDVTWRSFLRACVEGNAHYLKATPPGLLQPTVLTELAQAALAMPIPSFGKRVKVAKPRELVAA